MIMKSILFTLVASAALAAGSAQAQTSSESTDGISITTIGSEYIDSTSWAAPDINTTSCSSTSCGATSIGCPTESGLCTNDIPVGMGKEMKEARHQDILVELRAHLLGAWAFADTARHHGLVRKDAACTEAAAEGMDLVDQAAGSYFKVVEFYRQFPAGQMDTWANSAYKKINQANAITSACAGEEGRLRARKYLLGALANPVPVSSYDR